MAIDTLPLYDLIDDFRRACVTAQVRDILRPESLFELHTPHRGRPFRLLNPRIDFDDVHVIDFAYMFNIGSDKPETLRQDEIEVLRQPVIDHGIYLPYPKMLFVERTAPVDSSIYSASQVFITYIYEQDDGVVMQYFCKDNEMNFWMHFGLIERITLEAEAPKIGYTVIHRVVKSWTLAVPSSALPAEDQNVPNHYVRMSLVLIGALMRRGDEVQQIPIHRDPNKKRVGIARRDVQSVSLIHLDKHRLIKNLSDELKAVPTGRTIRGHDRIGTIVDRIKDMACEHVWIEEYRNEYRWRNRCTKCDSCTFWRSGAKVKGGAPGTTFHKVV